RFRTRLRHGTALARIVMTAERGRRPDFLRLPDLQEADEAGHRYQRSADVDDPRVDVVRDQKLWDRERDAANQDGGPDREHASPAGEGPDQPERHDQREER